MALKLRMLGWFRIEFGKQETHREHFYSFVCEARWVLSKVPWVYHALRWTVTDSALPRRCARFRSGQAFSLVLHKRLVPSHAAIAKDCVPTMSAGSFVYDPDPTKCVTNLAC